MKKTWIDRIAARSGRAAVALFLVSLAGCGASISFKRGASPDAMSADERTCREGGGGDAAFLQCMRDRGWTMIETGERHADKGGAVPATAPAVPAVAPTPAAAIPASRAVAPAMPSPVAEPAPPSPPPASNASAPALGGLIPAQPSDPLTKVSVASWWKLGGTTADLDRSIDACVGELGPAHRPAPNATEVTAALRACLRKAGWFAVGNFNAG